MTSYVRILTTASVDSTPSLLLVAPNGDKILVNCGEGCQRAFLEASGLKLKSVKRICLTRLHPTALGGLPGLLLTLADASESATLAVAAMQQEKANRSSRNNNRNNNGTADKNSNSSNVVDSAPDRKRQPTGDLRRQPEEHTGGIELHGPVGTQAFVHSLRHFMRRDRFEFVIREGAREQPHSVLQEPKCKKMKKSNSDSDSFVDYTIQALAFQHPLDEHVTVPIQSFIFQTPPLVGRFRPERAAELGIPKGPLYAQLKNGNCVTFVKDGKEFTVQPHQVLEAGHPGLAVVVVYCPTSHVIQQLKVNARLESFQDIQNSETRLDLMVHMTPRRLMMGTEYQTWVRSFPSSTTHIWMDTNETLNDTQNTESTPFVAASLGGMMRSMIHAEIYPSPVHETEQTTPPNGDFSGIMNIGKRHLEYILIPRTKSGIKVDAVSELWKDKIEEAKLFVKLSGALDLAEKEVTLPSSRNESGCGEILFTGTGSALPCKHRNVTGICLTLEGHQRMLLDCGEGTVGQLLRSDNRNAFRDSLLGSIQAVWISHPHADHHLGILRLLSERKTGDPLILIAPPNLFDFLVEYEMIDPTVRGSYQWLNCYDLVPSATPDPVLSQQLELRLGITSILAVPVSHCRHAFAVVLDSPKESLGRIAYSGDCRPSTKFADVARNADILIHEATFEDGMEEEALLKKHCTVGEALSVATRMKAKAVLLTHFSQRYPKMPLLIQSDASTNDDVEKSQATSMPVVFSFDFMKLTPGTIAQAAKLTDAMRLLYPEQVDKKSNEDQKEVDAKMIMSIPGLFSRNELL